MLCVCSWLDQPGMLCVCSWLDQGRKEGEVLSKEAYWAPGLHMGQKYSPGKSAEILSVWWSAEGVWGEYIHVADVRIMWPCEWCRGRGGGVILGTLILLKEMLCVLSQASGGTQLHCWENARVTATQKRIWFFRSDYCPGISQLSICQS